MVIWKPQAMRNRVKDGRENDPFLTPFRMAWGFQVYVAVLIHCGRFSSYRFFNAHSSGRLPKAGSLSSGKISTVKLCFWKL